VGCKVEPTPFGTAILCTRGRRRKLPPCACGRPQVKLCDFSLALARKNVVDIGTRDRHVKLTCDAPLCDGCAVSVGPDRDLCPAHAGASTGLES